MSKDEEAVTEDGETDVSGLNLIRRDLVLSLAAGQRFKADDSDCCLP